LDTNIDEFSIKETLKKLADDVSALRQKAKLKPTPDSAETLNGLPFAYGSRDPAGSFKRASSFFLTILNALLTRDESNIKDILKKPSSVAKGFLKTATTMQALSSFSTTVPTVIGAKETTLYYLQNMRKTKDDENSGQLTEVLYKFVTLIEQHLPLDAIGNSLHELIARFKFEYRRSTLMYEANQKAEEQLTFKIESELHITQFMGVTSLGLQYAAELLTLRSEKSGDVTRQMEIFSNWLQAYRELLETIKDTPMEIIFYTNMKGELQTVPMKKALLEELKKDIDPENCAIGLGHGWKAFKEGYKSGVVEAEIAHKLQSNIEQREVKQANIVTVSEELIEINSPALNSPLPTPEFNAYKTPFSEQADAFQQTLLAFYEDVSKQLSSQKINPEPLKSHTKTYSDILTRMEKILKKTSPQLICKASYHLNLMKEFSDYKDAPTLQAFQECTQDIISDLIQLNTSDQAVNRKKFTLLSDLSELKQALYDSERPTDAAKLTDNSTLEGANGAALK